VSKLNQTQKGFLKTIDSKRKCKELKKLFIMTNNEKAFKDSLKNLFRKANQN